MEHTSYSVDLDENPWLPVGDILYDLTVDLSVDRQQVLETLLQFYEDESVVFKKIKVSFINETGDDFGGLTKELFTKFWEVNKYILLRKIKKIVCYSLFRDVAIPTFEVKMYACQICICISEERKQMIM